jgi:hypothetical protein
MKEPMRIVWSPWEEKYMIMQDDGTFVEFDTYKQAEEFILAQGREVVSRRTEGYHD